MNIQDQFLQEEIRNGYTITRDTKKVWECQLDMLTKLLEICKRHNLQVWLDSGTLLGAIRDKGYIPWDDDIDVIMFRKDYDRLVSIADSEFKKPLIFQTAYNQNNFVRGHAQLRNSETSGIIPSEIYKDFNQGIFIDIFVLDYIPDDPVIYAGQERMLRKLRYRLELLATPLRYFKFNISRIIKALKYRCMYPKKSAFNKLYKEYEDVLRYNRPEDCSKVAAATWLYKSTRRDWRWYSETEYVDFEYLRCPVPKDYDQVLRCLYGEYMVPVKAPTMHGEVIFDTETPADRKIEELKKHKHSKS